MNEKISSFMDGELGRSDSHKVVDALKNDPAMREKWQRYNLYASVLRKDLPAPLGTDFHEKLASRLADEPIRLAPAAARDNSAWRKPAFGLAIAASLLAVVVIVQKPFTTAPQPLEVAQVDTRPQDTGLIVANSKQENVRERINRLLVEHNEYNPASDMTGMMPYSRFVSYNPDPDIKK